jgi:two-component system, cell cycle response regulator DivK
MTTILYVEDNSENRLLIRRILEVEGFEILEASSASEAMKILDYSVPKLILMDINMPEVDGFTLTARLKDMPKFRNTPIIALTANVMRGDREKTLEAGCDGYIQKPVDVDELPGQINRFLKEVGHG